MKPGSNALGEQHIEDLRSEPRNAVCVDERRWIEAELVRRTYIAPAQRTGGIAPRSPNPLARFLAHAGDDPLALRHRRCEQMIPVWHEGLVRGRLVAGYGHGPSWGRG